MSAPAAPVELPDAHDRRLAVGTFDHNLVVTAGAGTGKTTLLVERLVHLLLRNPDPLPITNIVALTFTNKAADEMKQRLRERLQSYMSADRAQDKARGEIELVSRTYRLSKDDLHSRAHEALRNLERADIGTIHSFAATILRLYPLEAGVDPQFREDDGRHFAQIFDQQWELWLDQELVLGGPRAGEWRQVLRRLALDSIKELAGSMCSEVFELNGRTEQAPSIAPPLRSWLETLLTGAEALSRRHLEDRVNEKAVRAAARLLRECLEAGDLAPGVLTEERTYLLTHTVDKATRGWNESDIEAAQNLVRAARGLCRIDTQLTRLIGGLLAPFARRFRETFIREGFVSFDGLLVRARNLLRDHLRVRQELKRQYRGILIDEFQDTDPVQYEILLYLAEQHGRSAADWREVKLAPGKVFVVGDPKQSIYAFRRADIEAYLEVVEKIIKAQAGIECRLTTNFRSDPAIIEVVNGVFTPLIRSQPGMQPPYIAIQPAPDRTLRLSPGTDSHSLPRVAMRKIVGPRDDVDAELARRLEGESIAAWLAEAVLGMAPFVNAAGQRVYAQPKDVAILLRKLTDIHDYLEPLRRRGIRYVVEGERHFYAAKEIIDAVNLLRAIENPHDRVALVGVLRSPIGALTDQGICDLHAQDLLDYRKGERLGGRNFPQTLAVLYATLARLHDDCRTLPVSAAVTHVLSAVPLTHLAARSFNGEQAVANLEKLRQQAELLGREGGTTTFKETIRRLQQRVVEVQEEGESVLAEEEVDAVRIMSVHKSKGLEFPIVVLAGCHSGTDGRRARLAEAVFDWSSRLTGLHVGPFSDLAGVYIYEKSRLRAEEEAKRVLYVAMTRAREHLILSAGPETRRTAGSVMGMLDEALQNRVGDAAQTTAIETRPGRLHVEIVQASLSPPARAQTRQSSGSGPVDWRPYMEVWKRRDRDYRAALSTPAFVTPTSLKRQEQEFSESAESREPVRREPTLSMLTGDLAHRFLEQWNFEGDERFLRAQLDAFLSRSLPRQNPRRFDTLRADLEAVLTGFLRSEIHAELSRAQIVGREVPLLIPWDGQIMEGVIDLIYEHKGLLYLADYKTDRIAKRDLRWGAERYRRQAEIYSRAARESLKRQVEAFNLIFLRLGTALKVDLNPNEELRLF